MADQVTGSLAPVRFLLGDQAVTVEAEDPTRTLLEYLRETAGRKGCKEGCAEGDCGACTVVVAEPGDHGLNYRAMNACILFLGALHGKQVLTVEDLPAEDGSLHPVQRAMVDCHGSQCGFCTPGFVMSLFAIYRQGQRTGRRGVNDALAGNLCRCTGYGPIVAAAELMWEAPGRDDHHVRGMDATRSALVAMEADDLVGMSSGGRRLLSPRTADGLATLLIEHPHAILLAGGTDVGLWVTKQLRQPHLMIYTGRVAELSRMDDAADALTIGAAVRLSEAAAAIGSLYPDFGEVFRRYGSTQVRNAGTLGGNVANGSPIGDSPPGLIALGARMTLRRGDQRRTIAVEDYFIEYGKQDRQPSEFVESIIVPKPRPGLLFRMFKLSKRFDQDISAVCAAFSFEIAEGTVRAARIAFGGMAPTPRRARRTEELLIGSEWTEPTVRRAMAALAEDFTPISDMRASAWYRREAAANLLLKSFLDAQGGGRGPTVLDCEAA